MPSTVREIALRPDVVARSTRVALLVGTILCLINHGDTLLAGQLNSTLLFKIGLTYLVPYAVATYGAVGAVRRPPP